VTVCAILLGLLRWLHGPIYSLPELDEVRSVQVLWFYDGQRHRPGIEVPEKHWKDIYAALSPSRYDPLPAKWVVLAGIEIRTKQGQRFWVGAYDVRSEAIGAFSVGPTFEERTYRRGGDSARLKESLAEVYAERETKGAQQSTSDTANTARPQSGSPLGGSGSGKTVE
jgi:hypothetical protein